ncbi:MAG: 5'/3'-nucleotidase SurE [Bacteroidales bacterium]|nr:5'/3'-nucleotidase SurE [Bacteroidales bacterium]
MKILITNDDGYAAQGLRELVEMLRPLGELTIVAPKYHQSGMSMAVSMGFRPIAVKHISDDPAESWWYLDGTPASCVKWAIDEIFTESKPDLLISGINHGANTASAALYSGTLGAAREAALAGIPAVGVSLDNMLPRADFSTVRGMFPDLLSKLISLMDGKFGTYYNVNFPDIPGKDIKGIRICHQGVMHWEREFRPYDKGIFARVGVNPEDMGISGFPQVEEGEKVYMMVGDIVDNDNNTEPSDHHMLAQGYITLTAHKIDSTDYEESERLRKAGLGI